MVMKTKICEKCKASFVPDDDESMCMSCQIINIPTNYLKPKVRKTNKRRFK